MPHNQSPFVDEWTDQVSADRYRKHVADDFERYDQLRVAAQNAHIEYGKWLIASTLAVHGGAIYAVSAVFDKLDHSQYLVPAMTWFVVGIGFTMIAGIMAWWNFQIAEHLYWRMLDPSIRYRSDKRNQAIEEVFHRKTDPISATLYFALSAGALSIWCFACGCWNMIEALKALPG